MNNLIPILLPVFLGLIAGISHGMASEYANLPTALGEETSQPFEGIQSLKD
jgi:hypothetical protein